MLCKSSFQGKKKATSLHARKILVIRMLKESFAFINEIFPPLVELTRDNAELMTELSRGLLRFDSFKSHLEFKGS